MAIAMGEAGWLVRGKHDRGHSSDFHILYDMFIEPSP